MYYLQKPYIPPMILIVDISGLTNEIIQLEHETGLSVNDDFTLTAITNCIQDQCNAELELEYYCLNLAAENHYSQLADQLDTMMNFLIDFGNTLYKNLLSLGVYQNGILPYGYRSRRNDSVCFMRKDALYEQIKKELENDGLYKAASSCSPQYGRHLQRNPFQII